MTKPLISREALALSQRRHERTIGADWRYPQFFNFLQVSPSYRLAHLIAAGKIDRRAVALPMDFEKVEATYRAFGDVTRTYFWEWWVKTAQYQFRMSIPPAPRILLKLNMDQHPAERDLTAAQVQLTDHLMIDRLAQGTPATLVVALPLHADRKSMLQNMAALLDEAYAAAKASKGIANWSVVRNKMRKATVEKARQVLRAHAARPNEHLYIIGNLTKVSPTNETDPSQKRANVYEQRRLMEIMTSRHLNRAYTLAENAARGRFPTLDPLPDDPARPKFDYNVLNREFRAHIKWMEDELAKAKAVQKRKVAQRAVTRETT